MDRTERLHRIDQLLHARGVVEVGVFLEELEVSLATFKRDLEYLRDRLNAPIVWDREAGGYRFERREQAGNGPKYALPGLWFNESEVHALMTMQALLEQVQPGLLEQHIHPLKARLTAILATGSISPEEIGKRIHIASSHKRHLPLAHFETVAHATLKRQRLSITHFNRQNGSQSKREISPQRLVHYRDNWYVDALCHLRQGVRSFAIDAILEAALLAAPAEDVVDSELDAALSSYGIFSGSQIKWARLRFGPMRARWASQTLWHRDQKASFDEDGHFLLEIPYGDDRELVNDLLGYLPEVEVLAPRSLRKRIVDVLAESLRQYAQPGPQSDA